MNAYYNECDPFAAAWLRELIAAGVIAPGFVDERSIVDVQPGDLAGYERCHFFAGIGGWDYALQLTGWTGPVWTGSCPCQPFSSAGKGEGFDDPRHLWPAWFRLIRECKPSVVFGEQVASKAALAWFDHVATDLEASDYAVGAADICAAGVGANSIRQRLFFVANATGSRPARGEQPRADSCAESEGLRHDEPKRDGCASSGAMGHAHSARREARDHEPIGDGSRPRQSKNSSPRSWLGDSSSARPQGPGREQGAPLGDERGRLSGLSGNAWDNARWIECRDGKLRPVPTEPALFPLATGIRNRVGTLRGAGNSICPQAAAEFVMAARGFPVARERV